MLTYIADCNFFSVKFVLNLKKLKFFFVSVLIGAMQDLDEAISLATEFQDTKVLSLALVQKGTILRLQGMLYFW